MFRKILFILIGLLFLTSPCFATNYYVDTNCADNGNGTWDSSGDGCDDNGGASDGAWNNIETAMELATFTAGDKIWIRRTSSHTMVGDILLADDGDASNPIYFIGYPRASHAVSSSDWVNGDATVVIDDADMDREQHLGRFITGPDGFDYLITIITDASHIEIDRPYAGANSANDATAVIKADEDYTEAAALEGGEVLADWGGDADDLIQIDGNSADFAIDINGDYHYAFRNIDFYNFADATYGWGRIYNGRGTYFTGCLWQAPNADDPIIEVSTSSAFFDRCIFVGGGAAQATQYIFITSASVVISNSAIYNCGKYGIYSLGGSIILNNVNIGVEAANQDDDISLNRGLKIYMRDCKLGGTNGDVDLTGANYYDIWQHCPSVNHNKVLGAFKEYYGASAALEKQAVTDTNANKKLSDNVLEVTLSTIDVFSFKEIDAKFKVWESRKTYAAGTYNVKVWIYNDTGNTLNDTAFSDDICMRCRAEAGNYGDATTEYVSGSWVYSDEIDILDAADADDWDYLQCDSVVVDQDGTKIYCEILVSTYDGEADVILIDPESSNP